MKTEVVSVQISDTDEEVTGEDAKPKFMSRLWWKYLFEATKMWKYDSRDWGINILSTVMTMTWTGLLVLIKPILTFLGTHFGWLAVPAKAVATKVSAAAVTAWTISTDAVASL